MQANEEVLADINKEIGKKRIQQVLTLIIIVATTIFFSLVTNFRYGHAFLQVPEAIVWSLANLIPNQESFEKLPEILYQLSLTIFSAIAATTCATVFAYLMSLWASETTQSSGIFANVVRLIASFFRNIPDVVWAMIMLFSFGQNIFTGFIAMFLASIGTLTRAFINVIDQSASQSVEALESVGASRWQIIGQAVFPDSIAGTISWIFYSIEENVRNATLIGMLTGSGIGFLFDLYYTSFNYADCGLIVICIIIVVLIIQGISNVVRRSVL